MKGKRAEFSYVAMKSKIEEYNYLFYINLAKKKFFKMVRKSSMRIGKDFI